MYFVRSGYHSLLLSTPLPRRRSVFFFSFCVCFGTGCGVAVWPSDLSLSLIMSLKWKKECDAILNKLGLAHLIVAGPSSRPLSNDRAASSTFADSARVVPLSHWKPVISAQLGNSISTDDDGEPPLRWLNKWSGSEALVNSVCRHGAPLVEELRSEIGNLPACQHSGCDSSSDGGGPNGSDIQLSVASDSCTGPDVEVMLTVSPMLSYASSEQL